MASGDSKGDEAAGSAPEAKPAAASGGAGGGADGEAGATDEAGPRSVDAPLDSGTKKLVQRIPLLTTRAGPRDGPEWGKRLKEELQAMIAYIKINKENDNDWFTIQPANKQGTRWTGKCWYFYKQLKYTFDMEFDMPVSYPEANPELCIPELEGKTAKMYRGGKICLSIHFMPLWSRNVPRFGIAHLLALGLGPWLAAEVPHLVDNGLITTGEEDK